MRCRSLLYSRHAIERMLERRIQPADVRAVVDAGEIIEQDPADRPYPSFLILGMLSDRVLHVVLGYDPSAGTGVRCFR